nr:ankyrin repeat domain-containing protein [Shimazuella soli]
MTSYLIEKGLSVHSTDEWGNTPLHLAAYEGFTEAIETYLQNGANADAENKWGQKPYQLALTPATCDAFVKTRQKAQRGLEEDLLHISLYDAAKQGKEAAVRYMLSSGVDPNRLNHEDFQADDWEKTPLYHAIYIGYHRIVDLLLQRGANPNVHKGVSLYRCAYNAATVQLLYKYGAKATPDQLDQACWEAVVNVGNNAMLQELIKIGAPLEKKSIIHDAIRRVDQTTAEYPKIIKTLVQHQPDFLNDISRIDETPLLKAVDMGNQLIIECLVELGADINKPNKANVTPLLQASKRGYVDIVKGLIEHGADCTSTDEVGLSPYTWAVFNRQTKTIDTMETALTEAGQPIPKVALPPRSTDFQTDTSHLTHFFHDDDWNDAVFIRWKRDKFLKFAYQLGFVDRYVVFHEIPANQVKYFFAREELLLQKNDREDNMTVTQYFAFHPEYPDAWMLYTNWWNEESDVDYTQFHFRCPDELKEETLSVIEESDLITRFTLDHVEEAQPIQELYDYSKKILQIGLDELWQTSFYKTYK